MGSRKKDNWSHILLVLIINHDGWVWSAELDKNLLTVGWLTGWSEGQALRYKPVVSKNVTCQWNALVHGHTLPDRAGVCKMWIYIWLMSTKHLAMGWPNGDWHIWWRVFGEIFDCLTRRCLSLIASNSLLFVEHDTQTVSQEIWIRVYTSIFESTPLGQERVTIRMEIRDIRYFNVSFTPKTKTWSMSIQSILGAQPILLAVASLKIVTVQEFVWPIFPLCPLFGTFP